MFSPIHVFPYHLNFQQIPINPLKLNQHPDSSPQKIFPDLLKHILVVDGKLFSEICSTKPKYCISSISNPKLESIYIYINLNLYSPW